MDQSARDVISRYLSRFPGAEEAFRYDARFSAEVHLAERLLSLIDMAMEDEGVTEATRVRILRVALYGSADPEAAGRRMVERDDALTKLERAGVVHHQPW